MTDVLKLYTARCHCERVKIQFETHIDKVWNCNCSYCRVRDGHWIYLPIPDVTFLQGKEMLKEYSFNTHSSRNLFCRICSIHMICVPRVFPEKYAVRAECIYDFDMKCIQDRIHTFDGLNWEDNAEALREIEGNSGLVAQAGGA